MIHNVQSNAFWLMELLNSRMRVERYNLEDLVKWLSIYKLRLYYFMVKWELPPLGYQKCNTDGIRKGNLGPSSYSFYIRNHNGDLCYAQAGTLGQMTNIQAKANVILQAVKYWSKEIQIAKLLEMDFLVKVLKGQVETPWEIAEIVEEIKKQILAQHIHIQHTFREEIKLAD